MGASKPGTPAQVGPTRRDEMVAQHALASDSDEL
jgi:hypothetical protein